MLHVDIPTREDLERLITARGTACVTIYLPTTPVTPEAAGDRIALGNLASAALDQLRAADHDRQAVERIDEQLTDLVEDDAFWAYQANSLAIFATPDNVSTFRLGNRLPESIEVADRFRVKPLMRAVTAGQHAFVLALAQGSVRLVEVTADLPATDVRVPDLPRDLSDAVGRGSLDSRSPRGRIQGSEGKKVRLGQFARAVDAALRDLLGGRNTPLILAAAPPLDSIFRQACTYPHLAAQGIEGNPEATANHDLAAAARGVLDQIHAERIATFAETFEARSKQQRTTTDVAHAAKAAVYGAIAEIAVDIDTATPGYLDEEDGSVTFAETASADTHGVVDQIAGQALLKGARLLALRREEIPGRGDLAAILRYPF